MRDEVERDPRPRRARDARRLLQRRPLGGGPGVRLLVVQDGPPPSGRSRSITETPFGTPASTRRWSAAPIRRNSWRTTGV
ncbi:hypothetical protein [Actinomadura sp. BRA 177]|uniref:hypothetical protein n=1 Tax=Actinomadura sp. BRA 177 TaxID=2745202 RepID=UPI00159581E7|nr:hypothetical protein [Actinomadura sp. BRA 177]NVI90479.1 hypothetical protein [Actinomadura sp. BRA 177]